MPCWILDHPAQGTAATCNIHEPHEGGPPRQLVIPFCLCYLKRRYIEAFFLDIIDNAGPGREFLGVSPATNVDVHVLVNVTGIGSDCTFMKGDDLRKPC